MLLLSGDLPKSPPPATSSGLALRWMAGVLFFSIVLGTADIIDKREQMLMLEVVFNTLGS